MLLALPLIGYSRPSRSVIVECANCATIAQQLISYGKMVEEAATEAAQLQNDLNMYRLMFTNTVSLPREVWANVTDDINAVRNLANQASMMTGNAGSILAQLNSGNVGLPSDIGAQFRTWQTTLGNSGRSLASVLGVQQGQEEDYAALQTAIQAHSQTAAGQMQAIQAATEMNGLMSTQLNQIQGTVTAYAQMVGTHMAVADQRQAQEDEFMKEFTSGPTLPLTGYQGF